ncbi:uncharacterized protein LOC120007385 [Tripterygium wilfordii]|uniref:uncharacterized protein LOC120007385 n=1 Tax=Tripterygium wilfordii TaxID=458696 RepID=UPI0018F7EC98|nr:uncharacterized protein LOC120007385 [Tripterygium wilfordii]
MHLENARYEGFKGVLGGTSPILKSRPNLGKNEGPALSDLANGEAHVGPTPKPLKSAPKRLERENGEAPQNLFFFFSSPESSSSGKTLASSDFLILISVSDHRSDQMMEGDETKNQEDKLPHPSSPVRKLEQFGTFSVNNEVPHGTGSLFDDNDAGDIKMHLNNVPPMLPASPSVNMLGMSQSHNQGIPLTDVSQFNSSQMPWIIRDSLVSPDSKFPFAQASMNEFGQYPILEDLPVASNLENSFDHVHHLEKPPTGTMSIGPKDKFAGDIQIDSVDGEAIGSEIHGSQFVGNIKRQGVKTAVSRPPPWAGAVHSKNPEKLDGSYLKLGVGGRLEARSESHFSCEDNPHKYMSPVLPEQNASLAQITKRSSLNPGFNKTAGFSSLPNSADVPSSFPNNAGVYPSLEQNVNEVLCVADNAGTLPSLPQNMDGWTLSSNDFGMPFDEGTGFGWDPSLTSHMLPTDVQFQYPMPSSYARYAVADHTEDFGDLPAAALTPHSGVGHDGRSTGIGLPSSSLVMRIASQLDSGPLQNCNVGTFHNLPSEPLVVSPSVAVMGSNNKRRRSGHVRQPQALGLLQSALRVTNTSGQEMPTNNGSGPAHDSKVLVPPLLKRSISQNRLATPQVQHGPISFPKPSSDPSTPGTVKTVPLPSPLAHTRPYPGLVAHHACRASMPTSPTQSPHIKWSGMSPKVQHRGITFPKASGYPTTQDAVNTVPLYSPLAHTGPSPTSVGQPAPHASMPSPTQTPHMKWRGISPQVQHRGISFPNPSSYPTTPDVVKTVPLPSPAGHTDPFPAFVAQLAPHASMTGPTQCPHINGQDISPQVQQRMISFSKLSSHPSTPDAVKPVPLPSPSIHTGHSPTFVAQHAPHVSMPGPIQSPHINRQGICPQALQRMISFSKPSSHPSAADAVKTVPLPSPLAQTGPSPSLVAQPAPRTSMRSPPQIPHIKWKGLCNTTTPPSGKNCPLCKRDLSYTPEGPVFQPTNPPFVACLPCGHMFHDHCLNLITPADMGKDPPCIPCAIGES